MPNLKNSFFQVWDSSLLCKDKRLTLHKISQGRPITWSTSYSEYNVGSFPGAIATGRNTKLTFPSSSKINNERSYTSTITYALLECNRKKNCL